MAPKLAGCKGARRPGNSLTAVGAAAASLLALSWSLTTPITSAAAQTPAATETLSLVGFGADPTGHTDSSAALQKWYAAVVASGVPGHLPHGTYRADSSITWDLDRARRSGLKIYGDGPQQSIIVIRSGTLSIICSCNAGAFYGEFADFGVRASYASGPALRIGQENFKDALNSFYFRNLVINNLSPAPTAAALELNEVLASHFVNIIANVAGHGDALRVRQTQFSTIQGAFGTSDDAVHITGGYSYGNTFLNLDMEVTAYDLVIDSVNAGSNTFIGGAWVWRTAAINATAGESNLILNPTFGSGPITQALGAGTVGIEVQSSRYPVPGRLGPRSH